MYAERKGFAGLTESKEDKLSNDAGHAPVKKPLTELSLSHAKRIGRLLPSAMQRPMEEGQIGEGPEASESLQAGDTGEPTHSSPHDAGIAPIVD